MTDKNGKAINFAHLEAFIGSEPEDILEVFSLFKNQVDMWSKGLSVDADDEVWAGAVHSIKGTARAVGAETLGQICESAERLIGARNIAALREKAIGDIEFNIDVVLIEIQRWEYRQSLSQLRSSS